MALEAGQAGQARVATGARGGAEATVGLMAPEQSVAVARAVEAWVAEGVWAARAASLAAAATVVVKGPCMIRHQGWQRSHS